MKVYYACVCPRPNYQTACQMQENLVTCENAQIYPASVHVCPDCYAPLTRVQLIRDRDYHELLDLLA